MKINYTNKTLTQLIEKLTYLDLIARLKAAFYKLKNIIDNLQHQVDEISQAGGNCIPLTGTEEGKPVTGAIEIYDYTNENTWKIFAQDGLYIINEVTGKSIEIGGYLRTTGLPVDAYEDHSDLYPNNKLLYAQRSYVDKSNSYSTDEIKTGGTWIDGKPIYRKVWIIDGNDLDTIIIDISETNLDKRLKFEGEYVPSGDTYLNINSIGQELTGFVTKDTGYGYDISIVLSVIPGGTSIYNIGKPITLTLEYTKTTD